MSAVNTFRKKGLLAVLLIIISGCGLPGKIAESPQIADSFAEDNAADDSPEGAQDSDNSAGEHGETEEEDSSGEDGGDLPSVTVEIDYETVKPYEAGKILVVMYHGIEDADTASNVYSRTVNEFKSDLRTFYDEGFRLISMSDYVNNNISTEAGKTPILLTFDDGLPTAFSLVSDGSGFAPRPDCAVDIINKFCEENPDFGKAALFFVNSAPFNGDAPLRESFEYLVRNGYEIGNHTLSHLSLDNLTEREIQKEIAGVEKIIQENLPGYSTLALSYPFGVRPGEELMELALSGSYEGTSYAYKAAFREGQSASPSSPNRSGYDRINLPRVRGSDSEETDLGWSLRKFREAPETRYISDGDPNTVSVPEEYAENIDVSSLGDRRLIVY